MLIFLFMLSDHRFKILFNNMNGIEENGEVRDSLRCVNNGNMLRSEAGVCGPGIQSGRLGFVCSKSHKPDEKTGSITI